jgi:hypothetical protein
MINAALWQRVSFCSVRSVCRAVCVCSLTLHGTENARYILPQYCINHDDVILLMTSIKKCNFSQVQ